MNAITSSRRSFLAAAAVAPVAIAGPTLAAPGSDIPTMIAEYWRLWEAYEAHPVHNLSMREPNYKEVERDGNRVHDAAEAQMQRILRAPSRTGRDVGLKIEMILKGYEDCIIPEDMLALIAKDARGLAYRDSP